MAATIPQTEEPLGLRVSAILVSYNQAPALRRAIAALEASQNRERLEILVVDCASDDESPQMDAEFPSINVMRLPHHLGAARAMNIATRTAKGDLLLYLSPNTEVEPGTVTALADLLEPNPDLAAVCPLLVDPQGTPASVLRKIPTSDALKAAASGQELPSTPLDISQESVQVEYPGMEAIMLRKGFVRGMNYFDQRFGHYWADADLAMQIRRAGKKVRLYPAIRAIYTFAPDPVAGDSLAKRDRISGAAAFIGKYGGAMAGFSFRLSAAMSALGKLDVGSFTAILSGQKLDGSQAG